MMSRLNKNLFLKRSLSARRAWIEMLESKQIDPSVMRRSPQGERG